MMADSLQLAAYSLQTGCWRTYSERQAVSSKPIAPDTLVYELYGLTEEETQIVEGGSR